MKKYLLILSLLIANIVSVQAQIRVFKDMTLTEEITDQGRIIFTTAETDDFGTGQDVMGADYPYFVPSDLATATPYEVCVTLIAADDAQYSAYWCGVSGSCMTMTKTSETRTGTTSGREIGGVYSPSIFDSMQFHLYFTHGVPCNVTAKVDVTCDGDPVLTFYEIFNYDGTTDIASVNSNNEGINFDGANANYQFATTVSRMLHIYSLDGRLVRSEALNSPCGTVNLSNLIRGVYVYQLTENGKQIKSGKTIIR